MGIFKVGVSHRQRPVSWWLEELEKSSVGCSPIQNLEEVFQDRHLRSTLGLASLYQPLAAACRLKDVQFSMLCRKVQGGRWSLKWMWQVACLIRFGG